MFYVHDCETSNVISEHRNLSAALRAAAANMRDPWDTFVTDTSQGTSRIIAFGSTGLLPATHDAPDFATLGGSCLTGRETL